MSLLNAHTISFRYSESPLFSAVSFTIHPGERIGLAGPNGAGKTTLLRILAGELQPGEGEVIRRRGLRIASLAQVCGSSGDPVLFDSLFEAEPALFALRKKLLRLESDPSAGAEYAETLCRYEEAGGYPFESMVQRVLKGLDFDESARRAPLASLSSGERARAALARCLVSRVDLLLLDEPTNHLDIRTRQWLEDYLTSQPAAFVVVSHDRVFLNRVTSRTLELARGRLTDFAGNYDFYRAERALREQQEWDRYETQQHRIAAAERAAQKRAQLAARVAAAPRGVRAGSDFYGRKAAKVSRTARILRERRDREVPAAKPWQEAPIPKLDFAHVPRSGNLVIRAESLGKAFGAKQLLTNLSFSVRRGERWAILGVNGSGKSTLLRILAGLVRPDSGELHPGERVKIGYYAQDAENLDLSLTAIEICLQSSSDETAARTLLGCLKLPAERVTRPLLTLSAGERSKAAMARLLLSEVNLLLLDEPTNHLEIEAIEALAPALRQFKAR